MEQRLKTDGNFTSPGHLIVNAYSEALLRVGTHTLALLVIVRWIIALTLTFSRDFCRRGAETERESTGSAQVRFVCERRHEHRATSESAPARG